MKTLILFLGLALNVWAADPQQPSIGGKQLIVATNGYAGTLNVRTQLNVGYPGQAGLIVIQSTNGTYALNLFVDASGNLTISNNTTLVLTLAANSSYTGAGTLFLSDDGTYKVAGGSGDTLWTNDNGTISANSTVTDGASAVAFRLNSSNALTTAGSKLATFGNSGTNYYTFDPIGRFTIDGHGNTVEILADTDGSHFVDVISEPADSYAQVTFGSKDILIYNDATETSFTVRDGGGNKTLLSPYVANGSTPYTFDTSLAHTSGNLLEVKNNGTNQFTVAALTGSTGAGTKAFFDDGTFKTALTINSTDGRHPYRVNATTFGDGPWQYISAATNALGFNATNKFFNKPNSTSLGIGTDSLKSISSGTANTALGYLAGSAISTGLENTAIGSAALTLNADGTQNTAVGANAGAAIVSAFYNTALGESALQNTDGDANTAVGFSALNAVTTGQYNVGIGASAGQGNAPSNNITTGSYNVDIGYLSGASGTNAQNEIAIGYLALGKGDNTANFGNSSVADIYLPNTIHFDRSATNVIYRSGQNVILTNGGTSVYLRLLIGSGVVASYGVDTTGSAHILADAGRVVRIGVTNSGNFYWDGTILTPNTSVSYDLGAIDNSGGKWRNIVGQNMYTHGTDDGAGNKERLKQSFTVGAAGAIYNTEAAGTGTYRRHTFQVGGTNELLITTTEVTAVNGFSSTAVNSPVTIASTGWTNTFGKNAVVYLDGVGLTFAVYDNAGTGIYTNSVALSGDTVLLQPSGKVIITGGTLGLGRAAPF